MSAATQPSGILIRDAPNYILYRDTEQYIRRHILPLDVTCATCKTEMTIDLPGDIYSVDIKTRAQTQAEKERWAHSILYPSLNSNLRYPDATPSHTTELCTVCPICSTERTLTPAIAGKTSDITPIVSHYKTRPKPRPSSQGKKHSSVLLPAGIALVLFAIALFIFLDPKGHADMDTTDLYTDAHHRLQQAITTAQQDADRLRTAYLTAPTADYHDAFESWLVANVRHSTLIEAGVIFSLGTLKED